MSAFDRMMSRLLPPTGPDKKAKQLAESGDAEPSALAEALLTDENGRPLSLPRGKSITQNALRKAYRRKPSFASRLPWVEYLPESGCFLLEDGISVGVVAEVIPVPTEGRGEEALEAVRDTICATLQDCLPEHDHFPWVLQLYARDETDPREDLERLQSYARPEVRDTEYTQAWLDSMEAHLRAIAKPGGLFVDDVVTDTKWRGQARRTRLVLYRRLGSGKAKLGERRSRRDLRPEDAVNHVYSRLEASLKAAGLRLRRYDGRDFHRWMMPRFNPRPRYSPEDPQRFYDVFDYPRDEVRLLQYDLAEGMLASSPYGDVESGWWYFDGMPHGVVPVEEIRQVPKVGHLTGEVPKGDGISTTAKSNTLMDLLPEGTEVCLTMVATPQEPLEDHINQLRKKAVGDTVLAESVRRDCDEAREYLSKNHKLYQSNLVFYVHGADESELNRHLLELTTHLTNANLKPVEPEDEVAALNSYLRWLPMSFDPGLDRGGWYTQLNFVQHVANLAPFFGRARGTGHPGLSFFNRGGGTFHVDPLNYADRSANAHMLIFGPTGAGKSATLNGMLSQVMAMHRPRLFVIEVGNSFGMLGDYFQRMGLTVNKVRLAPGSGAKLPPFTEAHRLLEDNMEAARKQRDAEDHNPYENVSVEDLIESADSDNDERDLIGEMETAARLMITGGEPKEEADFKRADRRMVRDAIYRAARTTYEEGRQCLTEDVRQAFREIARDTELPEQARKRAYDMGEVLGLFVDGFDGQMFNTEGEPWPECDVTIIDLAHYAREGYEAQLALSVISITNMITNLAEREQYSGRHIIQAIDESHIVTVNSLLSPFFVKVGKMGRKLSHWLWFATQNLADFPAAAEKLLNMCEWWILLTLPPDEVEQVARFKTLTPEQRQLMRSATKVPKKYTEGVVLSGRIEALFRVIPPSLYLALAGTEGEEKAARDRIMKELKCSELDAAIEIAKRLDETRGIGS
ncbi:conjugative transfer ATPase [Billgrantia montanilacus]|uniref:Conjugative transfer ATPase n=1 Tax=Billgrantia montanilacus TaxID=2282305 RepID=A0A368TQB4_9GAMM|nr:conjugative transfer ATPase [Halomonas montanilacus]RCV86915.1 conjugative transfer ATPase [Halomonas montanilacus]